MPYEDAPSDLLIGKMLVSIDGEEKTGKTHLALTAATSRRTMGVIDHNDGLNGVVQKRVRLIGPKKIRLAKHPIPEGMDKNAVKTAAKKVWEAQDKDYTESLKSMAVTFVDSGTETWQLARMCSFGDVKAEGGSRKGALDYDYANSLVRGYIRRYHAYKSTVIFTHQLEEEWKTRSDPSTGAMKSYKSGKMVRDGFKYVPFQVEVVLRTEKRVTTPEGLHFVAILQTCRFNPALEGTEFSSAIEIGEEEYGQPVTMFDLPYIFAFITETDRRQWT